MTGSVQHAGDQRRTREALARRNKKKREALRQIAQEAKQQPCTDCGIEYPYYVMQFDHCRGDKAYDIYKLITGSSGQARLRAEIEKCDVVCANCHAERTYQRMG